MRCKNKNKYDGFTLIEILVVIAIVGMISAVIIVSLKNARAKGRDAKRKADMVQIQKALDLYYNGNNAYPFTGAVGTNNGNGSGGLGNGGGNNGNGTGNGGSNNSPPFFGYSASNGGGTYGFTGPTGYIPGLAPNYLSMLPRDPLNRTDGYSGYQYASDGISYKLINYITGPESFPSVGEPFYDPIRPNAAWMICVGQTACDNW